MIMPSFDQFSPDHDFEYSGPARIHYLLCSTPRSGSHFLGHLMYATGALGYPLEYFHVSHFANWCTLSGHSNPPEVIQYIKTRRTSPNGCFGIKAHFDQFSHMCRLVTFDEVLPDCKFISIDRHDVLAQAISLAKAKHTAAWISFHKKTGEATYQGRVIDEALLQVIRQIISWSTFFSQRREEVLQVKYEDLCSNPKTVDPAANSSSAGVRCAE